LLEVDVIISELNPVSFNADIEPEAFADTSSAETTQYIVSDIKAVILPQNAKTTKNRHTT